MAEENRDKATEAGRSVMEMLGDIRVVMRKEREAQQGFLDDIAGRVFDGYRAALQDDFTTQGVIRAATYGADIKNAEALTIEQRNILSMLGAKLPGDEGVRKGRILGLIPLVQYKDWLVSGGQQFMGFGDYNAELTLTDTAIKAAQNALTTAIVAAGDVIVDEGFRQSKVTGIAKAVVKQTPYGEKPFVVAYETREGKKGEINVLKSGITDAHEREIEGTIARCFYHDLVPVHGEIISSHYADIRALAGMPSNVTDELRANKWRRHLKQVGVDLSQNAETVLADMAEEKVKFLYRPKAGRDLAGVMFSSDERYGNQFVDICPIEQLQEEVAREKNVFERFGGDNPVLPAMSVRDYLANQANGQRLTRHR